MTSGCSIDLDDASETIRAPAGAELTMPEADRDPDEADLDRMTTTVGSTGRIELADFFIDAIFFLDDTILRAKHHPECFAHIQSAEERLAPAGTLIVTSDLVGTPGGPPAPIVVNPDSHGEYAEFPGPMLFVVGEEINVQFYLEGAPGLPGVEEATLRSSAFPLINVTAPAVPDSGVLVVSSTKPLRFAWDVPAAHSPDPVHSRDRQRVSIRLNPLSPVHWGSLYCSWPVSAGHGKVPAPLLREFRRQLGSTGPLDGNLDMVSGDFREITTPSSSYVAYTTTDFGLTFPRVLSVIFD